MTRATWMMCLVMPALLLSLPGCKRVQLGGPVVEAQVQVDLLNQRGAGFQSTSTSAELEVINLLGLVKWVSLSPAQQLLWLGNFEVDTQRLQDDQLYFVVARGGSDVDADHNGRVDPAPTPVAGELHAIMRAADPEAVGPGVNALTEAAYRNVRDRIGYISDSELLALLNRFALMVLADVNADGQVDSSDVLHWSRSATPGKYRGDIALVDTLIAALTSGAPAYLLDAAAAGVAATRPIAPVPPDPVAGTELAGTLQGDQVLGRDGSPYLVTTVLNVNGNLRIEAGVRLEGGGRIAVQGALQVAGLPRQRVVVNNVSFTVYSWGPGADNAVYNADFTGGVLDFQLQRLVFEDNNLDGAHIRVSNIVQSADSAARFRFNIFRNGSVTFINSVPVRSGFIVSFSNNLFRPDVGARPRLVTEWEGPVANLQIRRNSFHKGMTVLRNSPAAGMDLRDNYWFEPAAVKDMIEEIIPDNEGPNGQPIIPYLPMSTGPDPDTPGAR